jgi:hypothetical protein
MQDGVRIEPGLVEQRPDFLDALALVACHDLLEQEMRMGCGELDLHSGIAEGSKPGAEGHPLLRQTPGSEEAGSARRHGRGSQCHEGDDHGLADRTEF